VKHDLTKAQWEKFVSSRRTTRDFQNTPVPQELIDQLLKDGMSAPSWSNTRPFMIGVAQGATRDRISKEFLSRWDAAQSALDTGIWGKLKLLITRYGLPDSDYRIFRPYPKDLVSRQQKVGADLYGALGIAREDKQARRDQWGRNYDFFGAPVSLFIFTHSGIGEYSVSDASLFAQNLMLSAHAHGLGTCAQGASALWAKPVRDEFKVPKKYKLLYGIALGYPTDHLVNSFEAERIDISEIKLKPND
jgi:nitroreductase